MDGYETARRIRADPESKAVRIIAVTFYALATDETKALTAGCNGCVTKPYWTAVARAKLCALSCCVDPLSVAALSPVYSQKLPNIAAPRRSAKNGGGTRATDAPFNCGPKTHGRQERFLHPCIDQGAAMSLGALRPAVSNSMNRNGNLYGKALI
jgi:CheY-like chemotaxis protein